MILSLGEHSPSVPFFLNPMVADSVKRALRSSAGATRTTFSTSWTKNKAVEEEHTEVNIDDNSHKTPQVEQK